ncbi:MAG: hypothetical protein EXS55_02520 [Candidatus Magasanikbacteria bacterium]|nr:hypothetical protein [Candidatus Magasanikbacteria bacterium]
MLGMIGNPCQTLVGLDGEQGKPLKGGMTMKKLFDLVPRPDGRKTTHDLCEWIRGEKAAARALLQIHCTPWALGIECCPCSTADAPPIPGRIFLGRSVKALNAFTIARGEEAVWYKTAPVNEFQDESVVLEALNYETPQPPKNLLQ